MEWSAIMRVLAALEDAKVDYVVVGGVAVNLHGLERAALLRLGAPQLVTERAAIRLFIRARWSSWRAVRSTDRALGAAASERRLAPSPPFHYGTALKRWNSLSRQRLVSRLHVCLCVTTSSCA